MKAPVSAPRSARRRLAFRLALLLITVTVVVLMTGAAELAARYYERHRTTPPDYFPSMFYPHRRLRYGLIPNLDYYGWFKINSLGFRGREYAVNKPPGVLRIVCLGASTTFDVGTVGAHRPWPEVLEAELRRRFGPKIEVMNLGIPGATSLDSLIDLETRTMTFQPDMVILYQGHNDFIYSILPLQPVSSDLFPQEDRPRSAVERWFTIHSLLYAKGSGRVADMFSRIGRVIPFRDSRGVNITSRDRQDALDQGLSTFASNLKSLTAIAEANGISLVLPEILVPLPKLATEHCRTCAALSDAYGGLSTPEIASMFNRYNRTLEQVAMLPSVHYISTAGFVPASDRFYNDPVHFNPEGSRRMGEHLAAALVPLISHMP